jgi:hypothetical protein
MYQSLFSVLLNQTLANEQYDFEAMRESFFESAAQETTVPAHKTARREGSPPTATTSLPTGTEDTSKRKLVLDNREKKEE